MTPRYDSWCYCCYWLKIRMIINSSQYQLIVNSWQDQQWSPGSSSQQQLSTKFGQIFLTVSRGDLLKRICYYIFATVVDVKTFDFQHFLSPVSSPRFREDFALVVKSSQILSDFFRHVKKCQSRGGVDYLLHFTLAGARYHDLWWWLWSWWC